MDEPVPHPWPLPVWRLCTVCQEPLYSGQLYVPGGERAPCHVWCAEKRYVRR
jgi:hypothetical protein